MRCPHCQSEFPLTWSRYLGSMLGRQRCPNCHEFSRLAKSFPYFIAIFCAAALLIIVSVGVWLLLVPTTWRTAANHMKFANVAVIVGFCVMMPFDKFCEERMNRLKPTSKPKS